MSILYYDSTCTEGLTLVKVEEMRNATLRLVGTGMHPRYQLAIDDLFKASNALMSEMKLDETRSASFGSRVENRVGGEQNESNH